MDVRPNCTQVKQIKTMKCDSEGPLVSVIVGCYNVSDFMENGIRTILAQTYPHFELILVNDGSTDNTGAKCDALAEQDERVRVIHKENGGVGSARNAGMEVAEGEFIYFCDCDDKLEPDLLERVVDMAQQCRTDMIIFSMDIISVQNGSVDRIRFDDLMLESNGDVKKVFCDKIFFSKHGNGFLWNKFYKRSFLDRVGAVFGDERIQQDEPFNLRLYPHVQRLLLSSYKGYNYFYNPKVSTGAKFVERKYEAIHSVYRALLRFQKEWELDSPRFRDAAEKRFCYSVRNVLFTNFSSSVCPWSIEKIERKLEDMLREEDVQRVISDIEICNWREAFLCFLLRHKLFKLLFMAENALTLCAALYHNICRDSSRKS